MAAWCCPVVGAVLECAALERPCCGCTCHRRRRAALPTSADPLCSCPPTPAAAPLATPALAVLPRKPRSSPAPTVSALPRQLSCPLRRRSARSRPPAPLSCTDLTPTRARLAAPARRSAPLPRWLAPSGEWRVQRLARLAGWQQPACCLLQHAACMCANLPPWCR